MIIGAIGKELRDIRKDKREQADREADLALNVEIRDVMRQIEIGQANQSGKLAEVVGVNEAHHTELIRSLQIACRAMPILVQQNNPNKQ